MREAVARQARLPRATDQGAEIYARIHDLLCYLWDGKRAIRLVGVGVAQPLALRKSNCNALGHESINCLMHWRTSAFAFRARPQVCSLRKFWCWKQPGQ
jgi:hypothetical protein